MQNIEEQIAEFISGISKGPFKRLNEEQSDGTSAYVAERNSSFADIYECAVYQAYLDMSGTTAGTETGKAKERIEVARESTAASLREYFAGKPKTKEEAFDGWFNSCAFQAQAAGNLTVDQAQKLLDGAFVYLYCCKDVRKSASDHFVCCRIELDNQ